MTLGMEVAPGSFLFFNDTATTEIYTLSLHDALPIFNISRFVSCVESVRAPASFRLGLGAHHSRGRERVAIFTFVRSSADRKSTRLNSSHANISYAVFCLLKKICSNTNSTLIHTVHFD